MKISVNCSLDRYGEENPCVFHLGGRRLAVESVLDRWSGAGCRYFEVSVEDGRRFVLRRDGALGHWELAGVYAASQPRPAAGVPPRERRRWFA